MSNLKQKFINSAIIMIGASLLVKIISAVYKIPLTAYIGATGRGYFNMAYNLYMPFHALIMGAFPVALTHLVSKYREQGNGAKVYSLKKASSWLFFLIGVLAMLLVLLLAKPYCSIVSSSYKSLLCIYVLAPTVLFSAMASAKRGFAEGHLNMVPTAAGQVIEALFKMIFGLLFAKTAMGFLYEEYLENSTVLGAVCADEAEALSNIYPLTAAAAVCGVTVGAFFSYAYTASYVSLKYNSHTPLGNYKQRDSAKEILSFSAPIIISTLIQSLSEFFDNSSVQYCLSLCSAERLQAAFAKCFEINNTAGEDTVTYIYGLFSAAHDLRNLIPGLTMAVGVTAVPVLSAAFENKDKERFSSLANSIFKYTSVIAFAGGFGLSLTAKSALEILYGSSNYDIVIGCFNLVVFYGFTMILYSLSGVAVFSVQAIGCASKSIPSFVVSAVIRVVLNYILVSKTDLNIMGAAVSDAVSYIIVLASNLYIFSKYSGIKYDIKKMIIKPLLCGLGAYFLSFITYNALFSFENCFAEFAVSGGIYCLIVTLLLILSKTIEFSELKFLQYCKKTA